LYNEFLRFEQSRFPKLAVGYLLDELKNDISRETPASFEPSIDYVVTKIPRFALEKFPQAGAPGARRSRRFISRTPARARIFQRTRQFAR
jgi:carbamoyl-phosphate synthase large subunit